MKKSMNFFHNVYNINEKYSKTYVVFLYKLLRITHNSK